MNFALILFFSGSAAALISMNFVLLYHNLNMGNVDAFPISEDKKVHPVDTKLKAQLYFKGLNIPTSFAFLGPDDILVLEKNSGEVKRIVNGVMLNEPLLTTKVATKAERGMLGIAVYNQTLDGKDGHDIKTRVFLYFTEAQSSDGDDVTEGRKPLGGRLYGYDLIDDRLQNPKLLLDLPLESQGYHNGGKITIGPDDNVYLVVGDVQSHHSKAQNYVNGLEPDGRGGILKVSLDSNSTENGILGDDYPLNLYYAYGIRNSFGLAFDPLTGNLWDTENGDGYADEINLVEPGFNSGWVNVQGIWKRNTSFTMKQGFVPGEVSLHPNNLTTFGGKGKYSLPEFTWYIPSGPTAIKFLNSKRLGSEYENDMFVGSIHSSHLYHFELNKKRDGLLLTGVLADKIANNPKELEEEGVVFANGLGGGINDIQVGPDGYLYLLARGGKIIRIVPDGISIE